MNVYIDKEVPRSIGMEYISDIFYRIDILAVIL